METSNQKHRVLVVDDSAVIRTNMTKQLTERGFTVLACEDGFEALSQVENYNPDIIFTDIKMGRLDGFEFVTLIRSNRNFKTIPVIMLSSLSSVFDVARGHMLGCNDYLVKPVQVRILDELLAKHLKCNVEHPTQSA